MENQVCILCSGKHLAKLPRYNRANLVKCNECGFVFCKKIPTLKELSTYYGNYPRFSELSPITIKRYNEILDMFEPFKQTNNLLDMGCSKGLFLECAKQRGWNVYGTELADECIEYGAKNNIKIFKSDALSKEFFALKFDIITSFEVIEHINNPNSEIELIKKVLRKGGAYYVTTPNFNALSRHLLKEKWNIIEYPEHLSYYTPRTLTKLMNQHGFKAKFVDTTGISLAKYNLISTNASIPASEPITNEQLRDKIEHNPLLLIAKKTINFFLNLFKLGDAMKALYVNS
jgi:2-polyprenyl-3-methyl-5-hydroxy-6-metoxy-1,4-benzoquinol methylase